MLKKTVAVFLTAAAVCLALPFCYGLWNEDLHVDARITLATPEPSVSPVGPAEQVLPEGAAETEEMPEPSEAVTGEESGIPDDGTAGSAPEAVSGLPDTAGASEGPAGGAEASADAGGTDIAADSGGDAGDAAS